MKIRITVGELNYGDVAVKAMPIIAKAMEGREGAAAKAIAMVAGIPEEWIRGTLETIPRDQINEVVVGFAEEYKPRLVQTINQLSAEHRIGVTVSDVSVSRDMEIVMTVDRIDYLCVAERFLPVIKEKLLGLGGMVRLLRPVIEGASPAQVCGLMDRFLGDRKDSFVASMINQNQQTLIASAEDAAKKQNIRLTIRELDVQA